MTDSGEDRGGKIRLAVGDALFFKHSPYPSQGRARGESPHRLYFAQSDGLTPLRLFAPAVGRCGLWNRRHVLDHGKEKGPATERLRPSITGPRLEGESRRVRRNPCRRRDNYPRFGPSAREIFEEREKRQRGTLAPADGALQAADSWFGALG